MVERDTVVVSEKESAVEAVEKVVVVIEMKYQQVSLFQIFLGIVLNLF